MELLGVCDDDFLGLSNKFTALTQELQERDPQTRRRLLAQLRLLLAKLDSLIIEEHPDLFEEWARVNK